MFTETYISLEGSSSSGPTLSTNSKEWLEQGSCFPSTVEPNIFVRDILLLSGM